jgi:hypothetical protein
MKSNFSYVICATLALAICHPAMGQRRIGGGQTLDNSLQVGTGGINAPGARNSYGQYSQAIVTGNVGGLARFRGDVGYRAPGDFSGSTGTDQLYNFRAQSYLPSPSQPLSKGIGSNPLYRPGGMQTFTPYSPPSGTGGAIFLPGSQAVSSGQLTGQYTPYGDSHMVIQPGGSRYGVEGFSSVRKLDRDIEAYSYQSQAFGVQPMPDGRLLDVSASPLTGVTTGATSRLAGAPAIPMPAGTARTPEQAAAGAPPTMPGDSARGTMEQAGAADEAARLANMFTAPASSFGERLGSLVSEDQSEQARVRASAATMFDQELTQRLGSYEAEPGEDVYMDLLRRIEKQREEKAAQAPGAVPPDQLVEPQTEEAKPAPSFEDRLEQTTQAYRQSRQVQEEYRRAQDPEAGEEAEQPQGEGVDRVIGKLDYELPRLSTLAGSSENAFNRTLARAEKQMAEGNYFDAEQSYVAALKLRPGHPLALVGRTHAQFSAGMFVSAGRNLRGLLDRHPELIATRYDQPLLPNEQRLAALNERLRKLIGRNDRVELPMLLAYLGYQQGEQRTVREAVQLLEERAEQDQLLPLLKRLWLTGPEETGDESATK